MHNDDEPVGRVLTRREALTLLGVSGAALLHPSFHVVPGRIRTVPSCVVRPEQTEGPYFVDERLHRSDIRTDPSRGTVCPGAPLSLTLALSRISPQLCTPLAGAHVDLWQCDAQGVYSDVLDPAADTRGQRYLRGYQLTDAQGLAKFETIYPGWYPTRAVHIHFKVRTDPKSKQGYSFTSQLYFDEAFTDRVHAQSPYATRTGTRRHNTADHIYQHGGDQLLLEVRPSGNRYAALFPIGLQIP